MRPSSIAALIALAALAGCDPTEDPAAPEAGPPASPPAAPSGFGTAIDPQEINGGFSYDSDTDVLVWNWDTPCSGTLLRNNWVLTARHCVTDNGATNGPLSPLDDIVIAQDEAGDGYEAFQGVAERFEYGPSLDVVLLRTNGPFIVEGRVEGESLEIYADDETLLQNEWALCQGYGALACPEDPEGGFLPPAMFLHVGLIPISSGAGVLEQLIYCHQDGNGDCLDDVTSWLQLNGDSGSSCRHPVWVPPNRRRVLGVLSDGHPCNAARAYETAPRVYRETIQDTLAEEAGNFVDPFGQGSTPSGESYTQAEPPTASGGSAPLWLFYELGAGTGNWQLLQFYDGYVKNDVTHEGTKYIHDGQVVEDGLVSVQVMTHDTDVVGLVMRARDEEHYYRLAVDEAAGEMRIEMRDGDAFTVLGSRAINVDFSTSPTITFEAVDDDWALDENYQPSGGSGVELRGTVAGQTLEVTDADFTYLAGRAGIYTYRINGALFDDFSIERFCADGNCDGL